MVGRTQQHYKLLSGGLPLPSCCSISTLSSSPTHKHPCLPVLQDASREGEQDGGGGGGEVPMTISLRPPACGSCFEVTSPRAGGLPAQASGRYEQLLASMSLDR